jgi:signal transduction histidine kinase
MKRPWQIWSAYCTALALVAAAVGGLSLRAWESDRAERAAAEQATLEENVRLALWRMDSLLVPLVAEESARPPLEYLTAANGPARRNRDGTDFIQAPAGAESPGTGRPPRVLLNFQIDATGNTTSPQVSETAQPQRQDLESVADEEDARQRLGELRQVARFNELLGRLPGAEISVSPGEPVQSPQINFKAQNFDQLAEKGARGSRARGANEYQVRQQLATNVNTTVLSNGMEAFLPDQARDGIRVATMTPVLLSDRLLLARRVSLEGKELIQGCWLDWEAIRSELLAAISDLLPHAELRLAHDSRAGDETRLLAALPVQLIPGTLPSDAEGGWSPIQLSLAMAWCALLLAAIAVAVLLRGVIVLSERRADFVSAVTHELRTPLTTFRMYAEMLAEGMVPAEADRRAYLETLRVEADRLTHLVENVLAYARLERGGLGGRMQTISGAELVQAASARLQDRAAQGGLELRVDVSEQGGSATVRTDPSAVEQILFNLVDNACKYAGAATERGLELQVQTARNRLQLSVRDHGPGISAEQKSRLFQPFSRSGRDTANAAPGVGLGLALSRRLARDMGGDLFRDEKIADGTAFVLTLPVLDSATRSDSVPPAEPEDHTVRGSIS